MKLLVNSPQAPEARQQRSPGVINPGKAMQSRVSERRRCDTTTAVLLPCGRRPWLWSEAPSPCCFYSERGCKVKEFGSRHLSPVQTYSH